MENGDSVGRNRRILLKLLQRRAGDCNPNQNSAVPVSADARNMSDTSSSEEDSTCLPAEEAPLLFCTKQITWNNGTVFIVLQNENGPCPLIAIANVLLLRGSIKLRPNTTTVTTDRLLHLVAECVLDAAPIDHATQEYTDEYLRDVQNAMEILVSLSKGLNVNVKFSGPTDFEPTKELAIFYVLDIPLFHGWVVFNEPKTLQAVGDLSYNELTEKIIAGRQSKDMDAMESALVAEKFLTNSATQMTYEGLEQLLDTMRPRQLGVLFRNNHFSTIYKFVRIRNPDSACDLLAPRPAPGLFLLVTDQGFLNEPTIIWETLENIDGAGTFVDGSLKLSPLKCTDGVSTSSSTIAVNHQIDKDLEYAQAVYRAGQRMQERFLPEEMANVRPSASVMLAFDPLEQEHYPGESKEDLEAAARDFFGPAAQPHSAKKVALAASAEEGPMGSGVRVAHMLDSSTDSALSHSLVGSIGPEDSEVYYQSEEGSDPEEDTEPLSGLLSSLADCVIL